MNKYISDLNCLFYHITDKLNLKKIRKEGIIPPKKNKYKGMDDNTFNCFYPLSHLFNGMTDFTFTKPKKKFVILTIKSENFRNKKIGWDKSHTYRKLEDGFDNLSDIEKLKTSLNDGGSFVCYDTIPPDEIDFHQFYLKKFELNEFNLKNY